MHAWLPVRGARLKPRLPASTFVRLYPAVYMCMYDSSITVANGLVGWWQNADDQGVDASPTTAVI